MPSRKLTRLLTTPLSKALVPAVEYRATASAWTPEDIGLAASVYADWMRVQDSAPAAIGGLLDRWTGQRASGPNANARFDVTPFANAPDVGAYGPSGEACIRFQATTYVGGSVDRGGAATINLQAPFSAIVENDGLSIGFYINFDTMTAPLRIRTDAGQADIEISNGTNYAASWDSASSGLLTSLTGWHAVALRRNADATVDFFVDGAIAATGTDVGANDNIYRWLQGNITGSWSCDVSGMFRVHAVLTNQNIADFSTWIGGGAP